MNGQDAAIYEHLHSTPWPNAMSTRHIMAYWALSFLLPMLLSASAWGLARPL